MTSHTKKPGVAHASRGRAAGVLTSLALAAAAVAVLAILAGCGNRNLILRVDLLSFLDPADTQAHYGPVPGGLSDSVTVTAARRINLLPGLKDVTVVQDVTVYVAGEFHNLTGTGSGTLKVFLSGPGTDPFTADPTPIVVPVTLAPATIDTVAVVVAGDRQLAALFTGKEAQLGIRFRLTADPGPAAVDGDAKLTQLLAVVTAKRSNL